MTQRVTRDKEPQPLTSADADACWVIGCRVAAADTEAGVCLFDRFAAPLLFVLAGSVGTQTGSANAGTSFISRLASSTPHSHLATMACGSTLAQANAREVLAHLD